MMDVKSADQVRAYAMPVYHFLLKPTWKPALVDRDGEELPDDAAAYEHAVEVARDIMRHREENCRSYRLQVCNENLETRFEILFASIDETLQSLPVDCRNAIIESAHARASLDETMRQVRRQLSDVRETLVAVDTFLLPARVNNDQ